MTVIGGLAVSTLLTLVVIPVVYNLLDRRSDESYVARAKPIVIEEDGGEPEGARA
jgi:HAE1 family hydrophobic/amphiphilic exporter-1